MTGNLTATTAQAQIDDVLRAAHEHRLGHVTQLDRLNGRWTLLRGRHPRLAASVSHPVTNKLGC